MKRTICALLALCLLLAGIPALALTGDEALGLTTSGSSSGAGYPTLQSGSRDGTDAGAYVVMLQNRLYELGYLATPADGSFGTMTESAVINFQETNGLTPTGIADSTTQSMLYSDTAERATTQTIANSDTLRVQQVLARWGFMDSQPDGIMGQGTQTGIAEFKSYLTGIPAYRDYTATPTPVPAATYGPDEQPIAQDLPITSTVTVNGQSGDITDNVLKFADGEADFEVFQATLSVGSKGAEVWRVQRRLRLLKYLYKPDGSYGGLTESAIRYFQHKNGLEETGIADEATQRKLFSTEAIMSEEYVFPYKLAVSTGEQKVYVYAWDGSGYGNLIGSSVCSTGQPGYETPKGTYQSGGKVTIDEWYYFEEYDCYAKYATRIVGGVLFHSVLYSNTKQGPTKSSVDNLGKPVSHGCVRLPEENAYWIFMNCPEGTTVIVY